MRAHCLPLSGLLRLLADGPRREDPSSPLLSFFFLKIIIGS